LVLGFPAVAKDQPKVIVLGFDGMDPGLAERLMAEGKMPNFRALAERGTFSRLETSVPPQSPVAWSNFITGMNPGGHGIYDFIARDPKTYQPFLSTTIIDEAKRTIRLGKYNVPLSKGKVTLLRKGKAFWQILEEHGIPTVVLRLPSDFPPVGEETRSISGMGTPDLLGTYGTFSFYTTKPNVITPESGGTIIQVSAFDNIVKTKIVGPPNTFLTDKPNAEIPMTVYLDPDYSAVKIEVEGSEILLDEKQWSDWVALSFKMMPFASAKGIVRFYLKSVRPDLELYMSPVQIDPMAPALPVSTPPDYSRKLASAIGRFYTQGIAEETWALNEGRLNEDEYLQQAEFVLDQTKQMLDHELDRFKWGMLCCYFSTTDPLQHMFWAWRDPQHPIYDPEMAKKYGNIIETYYARMDSVLGHVVARVGPDATIIVCSDHGFTSYRRSVHLNTWLYQNGYMALKDEYQKTSGEFFENVDWSRTKAYALGLNGLYINQIGREKSGIVAPGAEKEALINELVAKLEAVKDPKTGEQMIFKMYKASDCYSGECVDEAPDLIVGYNRGYRASWETALGKVTRLVVTDNSKKWSGDHCMAKDVIPGSLFTSKPIVRSTPALYDLAPSILAEFGIAKEPGMVGSDLFAVEVSGK
ncbi:MAG TPA: alkaline phosphatase family protein, partial [bacterium]|nr:alkaline phosphatase family protein [bacterium]